MSPRRGFATELLRMSLRQGPRTELVKHPTRNYFAFISYKHSVGTDSADAEIASWLKKSLEGYRPPSGLVGRQTDVGVVPTSLGYIFRDEDYLAASADLDALLTGALGRSANLIVVCSPAAAQSRWVNQEIRNFREHSKGAGKSIFAVVSSGTPFAADPDDECFPRELIGPGLPEPLAVDLRKDGREKALRRLVAGLLGLDFEDLERQEGRRERQRRRRARILFGAGLILTIMAVGGLLASASLGLRNMQARVRIMSAYADQIRDQGRSDLSAAINLAALPSSGADTSSFDVIPHAALFKTFDDSRQMRAIIREPDDGWPSVSLSRDHKRAISAGRDAVVWDMQTFAEIARVSGENGKFVTSAISPDDKLFAAAGYSGKLTIVDLSGALPRYVELPLEGQAKALRFSRDGRYLAAITDYGEGCRRWSNPDWKTTHSCNVPGTKPISAVDFSTGQSIQFVGDDAGGVHAIELPSGRIAWSKTPHISQVRRIEYLPSSRMIISASLDGSVAALRPDSGIEIWRKQRSSPILAMRVSPDGEFLALTFPDGTVERWGTADGNGGWTTPSFGGYTLALAISSDSNYVIAGSRSGHIRVFDQRRGEIEFQAKIGAETVSLDASADIFLSASHDDFLRVWSLRNVAKGCRVSLDGVRPLDSRRWVGVSDSHIATIFKDGSVAVFDRATCKPLRLNIRLKQGDDVEIAENGAALLLTRAPNAVEMIDLLNADQSTVSFQLSSAPGVHALSRSGDLAAFFTETEIRILDRREKSSRVLSRVRQGSNIAALCFSPDSRRLAIVQSTGGLRILDVNGGNQVYERAFVKPIPEVHKAICGAGKLAMLSKDRSMTVVDLSSRRGDGQQTGGVFDMRFADSEQTLIVDAGEIRILRARSLEQVGTWNGGPNLSELTVLSPDGESVVFLSDFDAQLDQWKIPPRYGELVRSACSSLPFGGRVMPRDELPTDLLRLMSDQDFAPCDARQGLSNWIYERNGQFRWLRRE